MIDRTMVARLRAFKTYHKATIRVGIFRIAFDIGDLGRKTTSLSRRD